MSGPLMIYWNSVIADQARAHPTFEPSKAHSDRDEAVFDERIAKFQGKRFLPIPKFVRRAVDSRR